MEALYVFYNNSYFYPALRAIVGTNPFIGKSQDAIFAWCPEDPGQTRLYQNDLAVYQENGFLKKEFVGRTYFIY